MPLRDHFHPPLSRRRPWDALHGQWPAMMVLQLAKILPPNYVATPSVHLGGTVEVDVGAFRQFDSPTLEEHASQNGNIATATWTVAEPTLRVETDLPDVDEYEVRVYDVDRDQRLVAAIELVSPANKDRPETRKAFVAKCATLLHQQVSVAIVDVVTSRDFNLYAELLEHLGQTREPNAVRHRIADSSIAAPPANIYAVACRGTMPRQRWLFEAWHRPLTIGQSLPALPIWLADDLAVTLELEACYEETCQVLRIEHP